MSGLAPAAIRSFAAEQFFARFGGLALGLRLLEHGGAQARWCQVPPWVAIPFDQLGPKPARLSRAQGKRLANLSGRTAVIKSSGLKEAFSPHATRGVNSSSFGPGTITYSGPEDLARLTDLRDSAPPASVAFVLQAMVDLEPACGYAIIHASPRHVTIEIESDSAMLIVDFDLRTGWHNAERHPANANVSGEVLTSAGSIASAYATLSENLGFAVNIEGVLHHDHFHAIQLRPVPSDIVRDPRLTPLVERARRLPGAYTTRFAYGSYDISYDAGSVADRGRVLIFHAVPSRDGVADRIDALPTLSAGRSEIASYIEAIRKSGRPAVWASAEFLDTVAAGSHGVALDTMDAFHLSHAVYRLPPAGVIRDSFRYVACGAIAQSLRTYEKIRIKSEGWRAEIR